MIVRETSEGFVLIEQHEHARISGAFAEHWGGMFYPRDSTLHAISNHDVAWRPLDEEVLWNPEKGRPYSFVDYPVEPKIEAYGLGLDLLESRDRYAACLCSMHYERLARSFGKTETEKKFAQSEARRQERLRSGMASEEVQNLERNLELLRLCDGLSLFVCLNGPGSKDYPPPYPEGFAFDGETFEPVWEGERTLRLDPNPFSGAFDVTLPYRSVGRNAEPLGSGELELRVVN